MKNLLKLSVAATLLLMFGCSESPVDSAGAPILEPAEPVASEMPPELWDLFDTDEYQTPSPEDHLCPGFPSDRFAVFCVTILWGNLDHAELSNDVVTDWSGRLSLNAEGAVLVKREIDFEPGQDSVLVHNAVHFAAWESVTEGDFDGLRFEVYLDTTLMYFAAPTVSFETEPFSLRLHTGQLVNFKAFYRVDDHNAVAIHSFLIRQHECRRGGFEGLWKFKDSLSGHFYGVWWDGGHHFKGFLEGDFWTENDGSRLLAGLIWDRSGAFHGELKGSWQLLSNVAICVSCDRYRGAFRATFTDGRNRARGWLLGEFTAPDENVDEPGKMQGKWAANCYRASEMRPIY